MIVFAAQANAEDGLFVRLKLLQPAETDYYVRLGGYIHKSPWYLPAAVVPAGADKDPAKRIAAGRFTPWFDLNKHAGDRLHGRLSRSGGVAEFPNVTADFATDDKSDPVAVAIELATAPEAQSIVKRFQESFRGRLTSFLVSPSLAKDAEHLETAAQMTARRLRWAREASHGKAVSPKKLIVQTSFWSPQRPELNLQEAEVLRLLGFNVVGNQPAEVRRTSYFRVPGHTHAVDFSPAVTRDEVEQRIADQASRFKGKLEAGVPFGLSDEITCRTMGESKQALEHFHRWLLRRDVEPAELGVRDLRQVVPIEHPDQLDKRRQQNRPAADRIFYYTSRFRQEATTQRFQWITESLHRQLGPGPQSSTLVADHPYFSGTGLGMGWGPNPCWGRVVLAADWFDMARRKAVDLAGVEDWMGLQYMYGPATTWEGFQLMGFQAAIFRSGSRSALPIIAWITPSDETNLRLKTASALCQGAKHFYYWTYGPTATSTENYWSDLRGAYDGVAKITRQLAAAEHIIAPGKTRRTRVALLYSISSDLWQPFGYVHMLERRGTYLSLVHDQYLVDMLTEEDVEAGRLRDYHVLYATDPCIKQTAMARIADWVRAGGHLYGSCGAGSRNEFGEPVPGLCRVFGIEPIRKAEVQPGRYHVRGALNDMDYLDRIRFPAETSGPHAERGNQSDQGGPAARADSTGWLGVMGVKVALSPAGGKLAGTFRDGSPAAVRHDFGEGRAWCIGACPAIAYIKEAKFVPKALEEQWPADHRRLINAAAYSRGARPLVEVSHPVVEAGVYDAPPGTALVLANFTYRPIEGLEVRLPVARPPKSVRSIERGELSFSSQPGAVRFTLNLGLNDIVLVEYP